MKRVLFSAVFLVLLFAWAEVMAVEVTVKTATQLYGKEGEVLCELEPGTDFTAKGVRDKWVWGSVLTKKGASSGWVALEALEIDARAWQLLNAASAQPQGGGEVAVTEVDPVRLRYNLRPGQSHRYEMIFRTRAKVTATDSETAVVKMDVLQEVVAIHTIRALRPEEYEDEEKSDEEKKEEEDRTRVELKFNDLAAVTTLYRGDVIFGREVLTAQTNEEIRNLLGMTFEGYIDSRGRLFLEIGQMESMEKMANKYDLVGIVGLPDFYPGRTVEQGESWTTSESFSVQGTTDKDTEESIDLTGTVQWTYMDRGEMNGMDCAKLGIVGSFGKPEVQADEHMEGKIAGFAFVDTRTGMIVRSSGSIEFEATWVFNGNTGYLKGTTTFLVRGLVPQATGGDF